MVVVCCVQIVGGVFGVASYVVVVVTGAGVGSVVVIFCVQIVGGVFGVAVVCVADVGVCARACGGIRVIAGDTVVADDVGVSYDVVVVVVGDVGIGVVVCCWCMWCWCR